MAWDLRPLPRYFVRVHGVLVGTPALVDVDAVRSDGGQVHIRTVRRDDADALQGLTDRASDRSIYLRFFSLDRRAARRYMTDLADAANPGRRALVAIVGGEVVAVAGFERLTETSAEVALLCEDRFQGQGIGTLMLEHLVSLARRDGIQSFIAEVLLENSAIVAVLQHLGYTVETTVDRGEARMICNLSPDEHTQEAVDERERVADVNSLRPVLAPRSVAIVGASDRPRSVGRELLHTVLEGGFTGPVYPVNPHHEELMGLPAYASPLDLPIAPDLAVVAVPSERVPDVVRQCGERGVRGLVLVTSGFREVAGEGSAREADVVAIARRYGMRLIGPNCLGVMNTDPKVRLDATFTPLPMHRGGFGLASQSGALGIAVVADAERCGVGLSQFVSLGNKADVSGNDLLMWWAEDPGTTVIGLYLESFGNPRKFARIGRRVSRLKPVIAIKSGRSDAGQRAGRSHTAAAASSDHVIDALCTQAGVLRLSTIEQFLDAARVLGSQPLPRGPRIAIIGNSGGPEILAADAATEAGLIVPELSEATAHALRAVAPTLASPANPVDLAGGMTAAELGAAIDVVLDSSEVDALLVVAASTMAVSADDANAAVWQRETDVPRVVVLLGAEPGRRRDRLPVPFEFPEPAAATLGLLWRYAQVRTAPVGHVLTPDGVDHEAAAAAVATAGGEGWLAPEATEQLLRAYGVPTSRQRVAHDAAEAQSAAAGLGFPVALKAVGVLHKTDVGGVRLDLRTPDEVAAAYVALSTVSSSILVQPMAPRGVELIVGAVQHARFGPLVMLGAGGVFADLFTDRCFRLAPLTDTDAAAMVATLRGPLLTGYRGSEPVSEAAVSDLVQRVSLLVDDHPEIVELDLNPVVAVGANLLVVDAKVHVGTPQPLPDPLTRRLSVAG